MTGCRWPGPIGTRPDAELANRIAARGVLHARDGERPVIHSDRGCHYRWPGWIGICEEHGLTRSMSAKGCSPDNAAAEGFFGRLKQEFFPNGTSRRDHGRVHPATGRVHGLVPGRTHQARVRHQHHPPKTPARARGIIEDKDNRSPTKRHHPLFRRFLECITVTMCQSPRRPGVSGWGSGVGRPRLRLRLWVSWLRGAQFYESTVL